jgi:predicted ester cyclase
MPDAIINSVKIHYTEAGEGAPLLLIMGYGMPGDAWLGSLPFMSGFREAFPDLEFHGAADLIAEGDYVVGRWVGGGTHTGPAFSDFLQGSLPAASGRKMRFTGTTVLRVENGKVAQEIGLDDGVTALTQLGLIRAA